MEEINTFSEIIIFYDLTISHLADMTGIHGVSSSLWLPISQSQCGKRWSSEGVIEVSLSLVSGPYWCQIVRRLTSRPNPSCCKSIEIVLLQVFMCNKLWKNFNQYEHHSCLLSKCVLSIYNIIHIISYIQIHFPKYQSSQLGLFQ